MPPRKRRPRDGGEDLSEALFEQLSYLGLRSVDAYLEWCRKHGFPEQTGKSKLVFRREREGAAAREVKRRLAQSRKLDKPADALCLALTGELDPESLPAGDLRNACSLMRTVGAAGKDKPEEIEELSQLLHWVSKHSRFLLESETIGGQRLSFLSGLVSLNARRGQWIRPIGEWRPKSHNRSKQFSSLARFLLAEFPVPRFMDAAWLRRDKGSYLYRDLFIHIGRGHNPRTGTTPVPLTKKQAHHFLFAPNDYSIEAAIRWGQVHALGGSPGLCDALGMTGLGNSFENEAFWQTVIRFLVANPMLDSAQVGPLIDFIQHSKFLPTDVVGPDGAVAAEPPAQPGFSMAGRTPESLLSQMERWHNLLGRQSSHGPETWPATGIGEFQWATGQAKERQRVWTIRELRSRKALQLEGTAMRHCVVSYAGSCARGRCSIWSLELTSSDGTEKRQTVEVNRQRVIVQSRGKLNVRPGQQEHGVLRRWAEREELTLATYL